MPLHEDTSPLEMARRATCKAEFIAALSKLRKASGLSYSQIELKTDHRYRVSSSTAQRLCTEQLPKHEVQLRAFLMACDVSAEAIADWVKEWQRLLFS
ncbi:hypothetical protein [Lentzea sp.]|uniref:hypothetical protein n=1 Tax=Lentzea sp. TaxID=56099 RepID=UPI002ED490AB